jgi:hypothetical protein
MEALRSLCSDYEELEAAYKDYERLREGAREQISNVLSRIGDKVEIKGFGVLTLTAPSIVTGYDKQKVAALVNELIDEGESTIAERLTACRTKTARAGGLRIEREKAPH